MLLLVLLITLGLLLHQQPNVVNDTINNAAHNIVIGGRNTAWPHTNNGNFPFSGATILVIILRTYRHYKKIGNYVNRVPLHSSLGGDREESKAMDCNTKFCIFYFLKKIHRNFAYSVAHLQRPRVKQNIPKN